MYNRGEKPYRTVSKTLRPKIGSKYSSYQRETVRVSAEIYFLFLKLWHLIQKLFFKLFSTVKFLSNKNTKTTNSSKFLISFSRTFPYTYSIPVQNLPFFLKKRICHFSFDENIFVETLRTVRKKIENNSLYRTFNSKKADFLYNPHYLDDVIHFIQLKGTYVGRYVVDVKTSCLRNKLSQ